MYKKNFAFSFCGLFLLITLSKSLQNYTINKEDYNLTVRSKIDTDYTTIYNNKIKPLRYDLYEKFTNNTLYGMQNDFRIISAKNNREDVDTINKLNRRSVHNLEDDDKIPINFYTNSTNVDHKENFTSQEVYEYLHQQNDFTSDKVFENFSKNSNESNIHQVTFVPYEMCHNITCILLCCPPGNRMSINDNKCIPGDTEYEFLNVYGYTNDSMQSENKEVDELFYLAVYDSCRDTQRFFVDDGYQYDYKVYANGSIYLSAYKLLFKSTSYCLGVFLERRNKYEVSICSETAEQAVRNAVMYIPEINSTVRTVKIFAWLHIVCVLFLMAIFLVYSILPELRNIQGFMLRHYTAASSIALIVYIVKTAYFKAEISHSVCITVAFLEYFFIMSSFFWLSAMSFNMWRTFRGFSLLQKNVRISEKRKLVYYMIFAYGCPLVLGIVCVIIVDFISEYIPKDLRPEFQVANCSYYGNTPFLLYFYGIKSICIISSVCLSISAALKIKRYEKIADFRLTDSENMWYDDNKTWFNLYKKLFIVMFVVMGINWSLITTSWIFGKLMEYYIVYVIAFLDIVQSFCIFIIFVWKRKIKLMLLKRFGFETK